MKNITGITNTRKFYPAGTLLGIASFLLGSFGLAVGGLITGITAITLNIKNRRQYRTLIGTACSLTGILISCLYLAFILYNGLSGASATDYWLFRLLFD